MPYQVQIIPSAQRELGKLPIKVRQRVATVIDGLAGEPRPVGCVKLTGPNLWRVRMGDYRVVYQIQQKELIVLVVRIAHRREVYRGL